VQRIESDLQSVNLLPEFREIRKVKMDLASKLKAIRRREGVSQSKFCELVGLSLSTYKKYESARFEMGYGALCKVANHPRFFKYTLWLMTDQAASGCRQVNPEYA
jgi:transcriptional regulator with XRE-family HTH domain